MTENKPQYTGEAKAQFDRPCEHLARMNSAHAPWTTRHKRGTLDLTKDGSQHRRFHSLYEDLMN